jgi:polysaccharide pyruvyl transferase WcaK-like protein
LPSFEPVDRVAFLSPCGGGNLGDAAIIASLLEAISRRRPAAQVIGFTLGPSDTTARHGVEAHPLTGFARPLYTMPRPQAATSPGSAGGGARWSARIAAGVRKLAPGNPLRRALRLSLEGWRELLHLVRTRRLLRGVSMVVVAGGGQLDSLWGGTFGHPYTLLKFAVLGRLAGASVVFASVGTGSLSPAGRLLVRRALALAAYRSFRDDRSREMGGGARFAADPTVPDLAYGLSAPAGGPRPPGPPTIGVSPMDFGRPGVWPNADAARYARHVESFGALTRSILQRGWRAVVFSTRPEAGALTDAVAAAGDLSPDERSRLEVVDVRSLPALFQVMGRLHAVVAARLHGALLAHVAQLPVLAISHERKVRQLMRDSGQERHCLELEGLDPAEALSRLERLLEEREVVVREITAAVGGFRRRVEAQYDLLFGQAVGPG